MRAAKKRARVDLLGEAMVMTELERECKRIMPVHSAPATVTSPGMTRSFTPDYDPRNARRGHDTAGGRFV